VKYNFLRFPGGKPKAVTLSYDDGCPEDAKLYEVLEKYGMKCTFNLVAQRILDGNGLEASFIRDKILASGHEIANHGLLHRAQDTLRPIEGIRDVLDCRLVLEKEFGIMVRGMAYPDRRIDKFSIPEKYKAIKSYLEDLDIAYARSLGDPSGKFDLPDDWLCWVPTCHHKHPDIMKFIDSFLDFDESNAYIASRVPKLFYMWGHSFEFERDKNWELLDDICVRLSGHEDIWYATNMEIYNYVSAYRSLIYSADGKRVYNPTLYDIWFDVDKTMHHIAPGEFVNI